MMYRVGGSEASSSCLDAEAGLSPVSSLSVVADVVVGSESDPLRHRPVLLLRLGKLLLGTERLVARHLSNPSSGVECICYSTEVKFNLLTPRLIERDTMAEFE